MPAPDQNTCCKPIAAAWTSWPGLTGNVAVVAKLQVPASLLSVRMYSAMKNVRFEKMYLYATVSLLHRPLSFVPAVDAPLESWCWYISWLLPKVQVTFASHSLRSSGSLPLAASRLICSYSPPILIGPKLYAAPPLHAFSFV